MIHKSRVPEQHKRGRMFETAMGHLVFWWARTFFDVTFEGHIRNRTFDTVQHAMLEHVLVPATDEPWDVETLQGVLDDEGELVRSPKSLMKHALMQQGSRDTSAQLFTALCRGLGVPARLVVSLQSVPWQSSVGKPKTKDRKGKGKAEGEDEDEEQDAPSVNGKGKSTVTAKGKGKGQKAKTGPDVFKGNGNRLDGADVPEKSEKAKGKEKAKPEIKLRKTKRMGDVLGSGPIPSTSKLGIEGRQVKEGEQPMKLVKMRASTLGRMREVEVLREGLRKANGGGGEQGEGSAERRAKEWGNEVMQGLYAFSQTELYVPDPVGKIPKNNFGNIDLYVPSMLPAGAVHIPYKGTAKIAKKLRFDYAEAVTGFEFRNRRATALMEERERVLKRWTRLIHGLRIRQSLQEEYKDRQPTAFAGEQGEAYQLPKYQHVNLPFLPSGSGSAVPSVPTSDSETVTERLTYDLETMDVDSDPGMDEVQPDSLRDLNGAGAPKTMAELAEETASRLRKEFARDDIGEAGEEYVSSPPPTTGVAPKVKKTRRAKPSRAPSERNPVKVKAKAKAGASAARRASTRKRQRDNDTDSDPEEEGEPSPPKRTKTNEGVVAAPPAPARTLRPRRTKTQAELQEEQELEQAFKRAVAG
ncbi:hypothetical protein B0H10DRAFT_2056390 [Mycena sp. CBHHK59/15]|nr:hypothetical protein B0H10DRAFT_2056390 [Mycena sp. CBHHK59/15]